MYMYESVRVHMHDVLSLHSNSGCRDQLQRRRFEFAQNHPIDQTRVVRMLMLMIQIQSDRIDIRTSTHMYTRTTLCPDRRRG